EDGIRDGHVTGVQTCALPILVDESALLAFKFGPSILNNVKTALSSTKDEADGASRKIGAIGTAFGALTAPVRVVASGLSSASGTDRKASCRESVYVSVGGGAW